MLEKFSILDAKLARIPLANHFRLSNSQCSKNQKEIEDMSRVLYGSAVGCLIYAMVCIRMDLAHAMSIIRKYMANLRKKHWNTVKWVFRYLEGSAKHEILFSKQTGTNSIVGYMDVDYEFEVNNKRSSTAYFFTLSGRTICWRETLQSLVAMSTTKAEYMSVAKTAKKTLL